METSFNSHGNSLGTNYYYSHFTVKKLGAQRGWKNCFKSTQLINVWSWNFDQESLNPLNAYGVAFWPDKNVLKFTVVMTAQLCKYTKIIELYTFKWVNCVTSELHLNKVC